MYYKPSSRWQLTEGKLKLPVNSGGIYAPSQQILLCSGPVFGRTLLWVLYVVPSPHSFLLWPSFRSFIHIAIWWRPRCSDPDRVFGSKSCELENQCLQRDQRLGGGLLPPPFFPLHLPGREGNICLNFNLISTCMSVFSFVWIYSFKYILSVKFCFDLGLCYLFLDKNFMFYV